MGANENSFGPWFTQFQGLGSGEAKQAPQLSQNGRRVLGAINENIIIGAPGIQTNIVKNDAEHNKNVLNPVTRKYAAQIVGNQQKQSLNGSGKHAAVSIEEFEDAKDIEIPMYVRQTEAMMEEIDLMDEVGMEMEDIEENQIMDIDICDMKNELAVAEYIDDIYSFYRKSENASFVAPTYMLGQPDINERMRAILIDWLIEVHYKFELMEETLFLTVSLIDRFLERRAVARKELQLVGITAMLMACKYEEVSVPVVTDFIYISDKAYTRQEILDMERLMLNTLQFNMSLPTPYVFIRRFLKAAQSDKKLELLSFFMIELCLVEYEMLKFQPSVLAAAAIYTAMCTIERSNKQWSKTSEWHSKYTEDQLLECAKMMVKLHDKSATGKLTGVHRKYSTARFGYTTSCNPAQFLLSL
uniref:Cyclin N-terminal domain-containing protein n=1 Tax=Kalanchoe fedtschenkoi TaxID=63787 RepID=A0A7N0ZYK3_KALFE